MPEILAEARVARGPQAPAPALAPAPRHSSRPRARGASEKREPRKIRFTGDEWTTVVSRARECGKPPARYVRDVALGTLPKARRSQANAELIRALGRIGNALTRLSSPELVAAQGDGDPDRAAALDTALAELLAAVRRIG